MIWTLFVFFGGVYFGQEYQNFPVVKEQFNNIMTILLKDSTQKTFREKISDLFM